MIYKFSVIPSLLLFCHQITRSASAPGNSWGGSCFFLAEKKIFLAKNQSDSSGPFQAGKQPLSSLAGGASGGTERQLLK